MTYLMCLEENGWICFTGTLNLLFLDNAHWRCLSDFIKPRKILWILICAMNNLLMKTNSIVVSGHHVFLKGYICQSVHGATMCSILAIENKNVYRLYHRALPQWIIAIYLLIVLAVFNNKSFSSK